MGWRERDWARRDKSELNAAYRRGSSSAQASRRTPALLAAVVATVGIYIAGHYVRGYPIVPAHANVAHTRIASSTAQLGSIYTINGTIPGGKGGVVEADGRWDDGEWQRLSTARAFNGAYSISFPVMQRGTLEIRVRYPGGEADGAVTVP